MRLLSVAIVQLLYVVSVSRAVSPERALEELDEGLHRIQPDPTWLSLGNVREGIAQHTGAVTSQPVQNEHPWHLSLSMAHRWSPERAKPAVSEPAGIPFYDLRPKSPEPPSDSSITSSLQPSPLFLQMDRGTTSSGAPQPDLVFSKLILDKRSGLMKLPKKMTNMDSSWFDAVYQSMKMQFEGNTWSEDWRLKTQLGWMETLTSPRAKFFRAPGKVYMLRLKPGDWGVRDSREVILRHHSSTVLDGKQKHDLLTAWSTANEGKSLVLLGMYRNVVRKKAGSFFRYLRAEGYTVVPTKTENAEIYLVSENDAMHDAKVERYKYSENSPRRGSAATSHRADRDLHL
ncbi:uncharacterized protein UTRI_01125_B [Ustilago trichophora]|uniref:Effector family protein Eff1 n=1 Tax=Ustilago trichophora TaxID=86804 RepID=A0A5C3DVM9_9BASI|nr:uncharacterized protein UTRI_01125_B [Ustilago trichophora]